MDCNKRNTTLRVSPCGVIFGTLLGGFIFSSGHMWMITTHVIFWHDFHDTKNVTPYECLPLFRTFIFCIPILRVLLSSTTVVYSSAEVLYVSYDSDVDLLHIIFVAKAIFGTPFLIFR